jgi:clusterin-associated protein 1
LIKHKYFVFRPAFLEEFEDLESELRNLYQEYITRQRCISYLEHQQEQVAQAELMHMQEQQVIYFYW